MESEEQDMQIIIDIPEDHKRVIDNLVADGKGYLLPHEVEDTLAKAVKLGIPLPKGHGRLIDVNKIDQDRVDDDNPIIYLTINGEYIEAVSLDYLNDLPTIIEAEGEVEE